MVTKPIPKKLKQHIKEYTNILQEDNLPITKVILFNFFSFISTPIYRYIGVEILEKN